MTDIKGWVLVVGRNKTLWHLLRVGNRTACSCWRWPLNEEVATESEPPPDAKLCPRCAKVKAAQLKKEAE